MASVLIRSCLRWRRGSSRRRWRAPGATVGQTGLPFRIDHDEKFNQTTHLQYTLPGSMFVGGLWGGFNWRYDSGQVAGSVPCYSITDRTARAILSTAMLDTLPTGQPGVSLSVPHSG